LQAVYWPILLSEAKSPFLLNTRLISSLEARELILQDDNPLAGEKVQYFVLLNIFLVYLRPLFLAQAILQLIVWLQNAMKQNAHGRSKKRQYNCL
jgi:hypothetical protein